MLGISKTKESTAETHPEKKETTDEKSLLVESTRKTGQKLEIRNLEENLHCPICLNIYVMLIWKQEYN